MTNSPRADLVALLLDLGALSAAGAAGALSAAGGLRPLGSAVETAVVALVRDRVPGVASVSVTRRVGARPATAAASDPVAERADRIQYEVGEGPCLHALTTGEPVRLDLAATDDRRWPGFRSRMRAETTIRSVLSHPLPDVVPAGGLRPLGSAVETAVVALVRDRVPGVASVSVTRRVGARPATA
ncbi:GAF domain-containing protein, partial [Pseudonocardia dioxanivorans]|uniref:GAF domain-containing protein n=1 Tax=Pseudonocardia dioxanivorans TaxID=240495 RepID=UPI0010540E42